MTTSMGRSSGSERVLHVWSDESDGALCNRNLDLDLGAFAESGLASAKRLAITMAHRRLCSRCVKAAGWKGAGSDA